MVEIPDDEFELNNLQVVLNYNFQFADEIPTIPKSNILNEANANFSEKFISNNFKGKYEFKTNVKEECVVIDDSDSEECSKLEISDHESEEHIKLEVSDTEYVAEDLHAIRDVKSDILKDNFVCRLCETSFNTEMALRLHFKRMHPATEENKNSTPEKHKCKICQKGYGNTNEPMACWCNSSNDTNPNQPKNTKTDEQKRTRSRSKKRSSILVNPKRFKCAYCPKKFGRKDTVRIHQRIHTGEKPYKCALCLESFRQPITLRRHIKRCHTSTKIDSKQQLEAHTSNKLRRTRSNSSNKRFTRSNVHVREKLHTTENKCFKCNVCTENFRQLSNLQCHIQKYHTSKKLVSKKQRNDRKSDKLKKTRSNSSNDRLTRKSNVPVDDKLPPAGKAYKCLFCSEDFGHLNGLQHHIKKYHTSKELNLTKGDCDEFETPKSYLPKEIVSTASKSFKCAYCPKTFTRKSSTFIHQKLHTGENLFKCTYCQKTYTRRHEMLIHQRIHTGEKPYKCADCPKIFFQKSNLTYHQRIRHTGEKRFKCGYCPKKFFWNAQMLSHERKHTGEKPFKCDYCPKRFSRSDSRCNHQRLHTGEKPFKCNSCQEAFGQRGSLKRHIKKYHTSK